MSGGEVKCVTRRDGKIDEFRFDSTMKNDCGVKDSAKKFLSLSIKLQVKKSVLRFLKNETKKQIDLLVSLSSQETNERITELVQL